MNKTKQDRYEQLRVDLYDAVSKAVDDALFEQDEGTCNFDSMALFLPNWNEQKVCDSAERAGVRAFKTDWAGKTCFLFSVPIASQGDRRTIQAEAMCKHMKSAGYEAHVYYQMD